MTSYYEQLAQDSTWDILRTIRPGDVITWGSAVYSFRVVANNSSGLSMEDKNGLRDYFGPGKCPIGLYILPPGSEPGRLQ